MNLLIDMGNSRLKWQLREGGRLCDSGVVDYEGGFAWLTALNGAIVRVLVACVASQARRQSLIAALCEYGLPEAEFAVTRERAAGVICGYKDHSALGVDRWLALLGARALGDGPWVVVDSGTALTVDLLDHSGVHLGGYIAPGLSLMRRALACESEALGAVLAQEAFAGGAGAGVDTRSAIDNAIFSMGRGLISDALARLDKAGLLLAGGDASVWLRAFPAARRVDGLVFDGLERCFRG